MERQKNSSLVSAGGLSLSVCFAACLGASTVVLNSSAIVVVSWNQALNVSSPVSRMSLMHWLTLATSLKAETMSCAFFCKLTVSGLMYCKHFRATTYATRNGPLLICVRKPFAEDSVSASQLSRPSTPICPRQSTTTPINSANVFLKQCVALPSEYDNDPPVLFSCYLVLRQGLSLLVFFVALVTF